MTRKFAKPLKSMKLIAIILVSLALILSGCSSKAPQAQEEGKTIKLNFATFWPGENFYVTEGHNAWIKTIKDRVEQETNHTIDISVFPGGVLLGATEIYEGVVNGAADIGSTCPSYTPGAFPSTTALELPGLKNDNAVVSSLTMEEAYKTIEEINKEYEDVKVMLFWATGPGDLFTQKPVRTLEDLKGMEIRAAAGSVPALNALGAVPVTMPMGESYLALNQGIVKGILGPAEIMKGFRLAEVTKSTTKTPFLYNTVFVKVMNLSTWNSLPSEVQKIIEEVNAEFVIKYAELGKVQSELGNIMAVEDYNHELIELSSEEEGRWLEALAKVQDEWIQQVEKIGLPGSEILEKVKELDNKYSEQFGS
ncbi:MAG: TRAP transporter substrate-binding protein [Clostridia bacterium]|nr:TRAP transporter substrate-binding protein [Clostridia bacterium]